MVEIYFGQRGDAADDVEVAPPDSVAHFGEVPPVRLPHLAMLLSVAACSSEPPPAKEATSAPIVVTDAFVYAPLSAAQAAGYFVVHNRSATPDTIRAIAVDWAREASIHETTESEGMVRMSHLEVLVVPARDSVRLVSGGIHVMFTDLFRLPVAGDTVELTLQLARGGRIVVPAAVRPYGQ